MVTLSKKMGKGERSRNSSTKRPPGILWFLPNHSREVRATPPCSQQCSEHLVRQEDKLHLPGLSFLPGPSHHRAVSLQYLPRKQIPLRLSVLGLSLQGPRFGHSCQPCLILLHCSVCCLGHVFVLDILSPTPRTYSTWGCL